jgi:hypothetical protein
MFGNSQSGGHEIPHPWKAGLSAESYADRAKPAE